MKCLPEFYFFVMFTLSSKAHGFFTSVVDENQTSSWLHHADCAYPANFHLVSYGKEKDATFVRKATIGETFKISVLTDTLAEPQLNIVCLGMGSVFALLTISNWSISQIYDQIL
jgi:hypothetical protein